MSFKPTVRDALGLALSTAAVMLALFLPPAGVLQSCDFSRLNGIDAQFYADAVRHGHLPFWNPYVYLGRPFLADVETGVLYPPHLLYALLGVNAGLVALCILHGAFAALGMWLLARCVGANRFAAHLAAVAWLGSGALAGRLLAGQLQFFFSASYLPWLFFLAFMLQRRFALRTAAWIALLAALSLLAGHPQVFWLGALGMALTLVAGFSCGTGSLAVGCPCVAHLKRGFPWQRCAVALAGLAGALALSLGLCAAQLLPLLELIQHSNRRAPTLDFAAYMSLPAGALLTAFRPVSVSYPINWEYNLYIALPLLPAALPVIFAPRSRRAWALVCVAALSLLLALGLQTPFFAMCYRILPGVSSFRIHARAAVLAVIALLALGALGLTRLQARRRSLLWLFATSLVAASLAISLFWMREAYAVPPLELNDAAFVQMLQQEKLYAPSHVPPRVSIPDSVMRENAGMLYGYSTFNGYTALALERVWTFLHRRLNLAPPEQMNTYPSEKIFNAGPFPYDCMNLQAGFDPTSGRTLIRHDADPRAFLAGQTELVPRWEDALEKICAGYDLHRTALVEDAAALLPAGPELSGSAEIVSFQNEELLVATRANRPALLVLSEAWYPGWRGSIDGDGAEQPCVPANVWMRALPVPAGEHRVRIYFQQPHFALGCAISLACLVLCLTALLRNRR